MKAKTKFKYKTEEERIIATTKISKNNQTSVPKRVREILGINHEDDLIWYVEDSGGVSIESKLEKAKRIMNETAGKGKSLYKQFGNGTNWLRKERDESWD